MKFSIYLYKRVFVMRVLIDPLDAKQRFRSDSADAKADLSSLGHMPFFKFCHALAIFSLFINTSTI